MLGDNIQLLSILTGDAVSRSFMTFFTKGGALSESIEGSVVVELVDEYRISSTISVSEDVSDGPGFVEEASIRTHEECRLLRKLDRYRPHDSHIAKRL